MSYGGSSALENNPRTVHMFSVVHMRTSFALSGALVSVASVKVSHVPGFRLLLFRCQDAFGIVWTSYVLTDLLATPLIRTVALLYA